MCGLVTDGKVLACYGMGKVIDTFKILSDDDVQKKMAKRLKKARKRARFEYYFKDFLIRKF